MIEAKCFTNLDAYIGAQWPQKFAFPPRVGDYVQAEDKRRLRIVSVMHSTAFNNTPLVIIELHN